MTAPSEESPTGLFRAGRAALGKGMTMLLEQTTRVTSADLVFNHLYEQIMSLSLEPGEKISEAEIAGKLGLSRQPVRDAFNRLANLGLLLVQPQRPTLVRPFSMSSISNARFVRAAIEVEIARNTVANWTDTCAPGFEKIISRQEAAAATHDLKAFHDLDEEFHREIALIAKRLDAFDMAMSMKAQIDRICVLSLKNDDELQAIIDDHKAIFSGLQQRDEKAVDAALRKHLSRILDTIEAVQKSHPKYFNA